MPWLTRLAAMFRHNRGHSLGDLENRVVDLERRLTVIHPTVREAPTVPEARAGKMAIRRGQAESLLKQGHSQSEVARRLGVSRQYIHQLVHKGL